MKKKPPHESQTQSTQKRQALLKTALSRLQKQNPAYSLRALAAKIGCSAGFLSKVLAGKSELPRDRVDDFVKAFKMDTLSEKALWQTYIDSDMPSWLTADSKRKIDVSQAQEWPEKFHSVLGRWYFLAILDLSACEGFKAEPPWIAERLGITRNEAEMALQLLKANQYLIELDGVWKKAEAFVRLPALESKEAIRHFHEQMLKKAITYMNSKTSPSDYKNRLISGFMIPANPAQLERAKMKMHEAMLEVVAILGEGELTELYYFADVLFPLTQLQK